jgi:beta-phosphoglucomutase-like phosphatase (HAD superfamily)
VAIEDSPPGVAAAVAAGAATIGIPLNAPFVAGIGYTIWTTLAGRGLADLSEVLDSRRPA